MPKENKKYYWLQLHKDFFKRHDMRIIKAMPNGKDYIIFYMHLLLESIDHEGKLRFSEFVPYNEEMLSVITDTNVDVVRSAIKIFQQLGLMEVLDDKTYYMTETQKMIGQTTQWALDKQDYREKKKQLELDLPQEDIRKTSEDNVRQEIELEIELDIYNTKKKKVLKKEIEVEVMQNYFEWHNLNKVFHDWLIYKKQRKEKLTDIGLTKLISEVKNKAIKVGVDAVIDRINFAIASGWVGMNLHRMEEKDKTPQARMKFN